MPRSSGGVIQILGTGQLLELRRRLHSAGGPRLQQNFARRIRRAAEPLHRDLQQRTRTLHIAGIKSKTRKPKSSKPGRGGVNRPLRAAIADATRISVRGGSMPGARIWIDRSQIPQDFRTAPEKLNEGSWRHPTFGNPHLWTTQVSRPVLYWDKTLRKHHDRMRTEVERVLNDVQRMLG